MRAAYILLVAAAGVLMAASCWLPALICAAGAFALACRFEVRWLLDHTPLTRYDKPRPVPRRG